MGGGEVDGMTSHFVVVLAFSRLCGFTFWYYGYVELYRVSKVAAYQLLFAHGLQALLCLDFVYYYFGCTDEGEADATANCARHLSAALGLGRRRSAKIAR